MGRKILLIDDDTVLLTLMKSAFSAAGYVVQAADNGRKGLKALESYEPDLVITDIVMPELEGIGTIMAIKKKPRAPKVIAISGVGRLRDSDYLKWASHLGADEVLAKPFKMSELLRLSRQVIETASPNPKPLEV
jgi:DNA-binding response OmpR family regulator